MDLRKLSDEELKALVGEEVYQQACSVAIDSYDKEETFWDEIYKHLKE